MRAELGESFVLTLSPSGEPCLLAYSIADWDDVTDKLLEDEPSEFTVMRQRMISINSELVEVKAKGLITIPARFVKEVGLKDEVYLLGNGHHLELWAPENYAQMLKRYESLKENQKTYFYK